MKDYKILKSILISELEEIVTLHIESGYKPVGTPFELNLELCQAVYINEGMND